MFLIHLESFWITYSLSLVSTPAGKGNITAYVDEFVEVEVEKLADESGLNRSRYVTALLLDAIERKRLFRLRNGKFIEENVKRNQLRTA